MNTKSGYRLIYADPEDGEFIDCLAKAMRVDRKEVIRLAISLLALLILTPEKTHHLLSETIRNLKEGRA